MALSSYNGWPASRDPKAIGINAEWEPIPGHRFPGGIKSGDVEVVMTYFAQQLDKRVEPVDRDAVKDEWGWFYKPSANSPDLLSCHSSGTAFDWNATRHPNGHRGTFNQNQVAEIRKIQAEVGGVVRWLGDAARTADEMHFEIHGTPREVAKVADRLRAPKPVAPASTPSPPTPLEEDDLMQPFKTITNNGIIYMVTPQGPVQVKGPADLTALRKRGIVDDDPPAAVTKDQLDLWVRAD